MKKNIFLFAILIFIVGCSDKGENSKEKAQKSPNKNKVEVTPNDITAILSDSGQSSVVIKKDEENNGFILHSKEITYSTIYIAPKEDLEHFLQKRTTVTNKTTFSEGQERTIEVELIPLKQLNQNRLTFKENCDEMVFEFNHIKAIKYGCCAEPDEIKLIDYSNREIIKGHRKILQARIVNKSPDLDFFVSYLASDGSDKKKLATVCISYNPTEKYFINLKTESETDGLLESSWMVPDFILDSKNSRDVLVNENTGFEIYSLEKIKSFNEINGITIKVPLLTGEIPDTLEIPIINGKPFGKKEKLQEIIVSK